MMISYSLAVIIVIVIVIVQSRLINIISHLTPISEPLPSTVQMSFTVAWLGPRYNIQTIYRFLLQSPMLRFLADRWARVRYLG
jgi:hypothetical protein